MSHSAHEKKDEDKPLPKDKWETGHSQAAMVAHTCDLSTQKAEIGGFLRVKDSLGYRDPVLKKEKERKKAKRKEKKYMGLGIKLN